MLSPSDPLPLRPRRVIVAGTSGSGKSTFTRRLAAASGIPYQEIDALRHGPGWTPRPSFMEEVAAFTSRAEWATEWLYADARDLLASRAQLLVWLDYPRPLVMFRVLRRTVRRQVRREVLWNGNVEPPLRTAFTDADHIVRWAWRTHSTWSSLVEGAAARHPQLTIVRLRSPREAETWLSGAFAQAVR
ncbi:AAA family ATPase [Agromyces albus]|uniref:AAA family ATPase n=1 Tax=Agromyces albus TaxID=205332 RepID=UPI0027D7D8F4|nr:AAA family ATPase [Agromyces albus]